MNPSLPGAESVEGGDAEEVHVAVGGALDGVEDEPEGQAQRDHGDQAVLDDAAEQLRRHVKLLLGVLHGEWANGELVKASQGLRNRPGF